MHTYNNAHKISFYHVTRYIGSTCGSISIIGMQFLEINKYIIFRMMTICYLINIDIEIKMMH